MSGPITEALSMPRPAGARRPELLNALALLIADLREPTSSWSDGDLIQVAAMSVDLHQAVGEVRAARPPR